MKDNNLRHSGFSVAYAVQRNVGEEWNEVKWDSHHHHIQYHRLYLLTEGEAKIYLYDRVIDLRPGFVYFIPAYSVKKSSIDGTMNKYYIHFQAEDSVFSLFRYFSDSYSKKVTPLTEELFKTVVDNYHAGSISSRLKVQGAMSLILADFLSEIKVEPSVLGRFERVLSYIDENYRKPISLSTLATLMNLNTAYFANLFKSTFHISPKQYILNKRLEESERLLLETGMSIKEIAFAVGFENENYFSEFFKEKVGAPASKFRSGSIPEGLKSVL